MIFSYPLAVLFTLFITFALYDKKQLLIFTVKDFSCFFILLIISGHSLVDLYKESLLPANPYFITTIWFSWSLIYSFFILGKRIVRHLKNRYYKAKVKKFKKQRPSITVSYDEFQKFCDDARELVFIRVQQGVIKVPFKLSKNIWYENEEKFRNEFVREIFNNTTTPTVLSYDMLNNYLHNPYDGSKRAEYLRKCYILTLMYVIFLDD